MTGRYDPHEYLTTIEDIEKTVGIELFEKVPRKCIEQKLKITKPEIEELKAKCNDIKSKVKITPQVS